ncbi:MAG: hypothetical protein SO373_06015 [Candidatus Borkfalkiaceae bacterium]|nr:hypothetical protein [Christensenellaceae bacterium]
MNEVNVRQLNNIYATFSVCSDKSITVRAILFGAIAHGKTTVLHPLICEDTLAAEDCAKKMGAVVKYDGEKMIIDGAGKIADGKEYDCKRSGTVLRLLCGILAGAGVNAILTGDDQLKSRPIGRIIAPLTARGADISFCNGKYPIVIKPSKIKDFTYEMPIDSAQVKSSVILSGVVAGVSTEIIEKNYTRDHTEKMLSAMGANIDVDGKNITVSPAELRSTEFDVPGDPSAAAFYLAIGLYKGCVKVKSINISPKRAGYLYKLLGCGADITFENKRIVCGEPCADVTARKSNLKHIEIFDNEIPSMIDELPVIGLIGGLFNGVTIHGAGELKVKESDRFSGIIDILSAAGGLAKASGDDIIINGGIAPRCFEYSSDDHRLTMTAFVAMCCGAGGKILNALSVNKSFPNFFENFYEFNAALLGSNVEKSLSGRTHNFFIEKLGKIKNYSYELCSVDSETAEEIIKKSRYKSINATIPYKELVFDNVKTLSETAKLARSVNFVFDNKGYSSDGVGLIYSLLLHGKKPQGEKVLVCGIGGAGRSIAVALAKYKAEVYIANRTEQKIDDFINYYTQNCENVCRLRRYNGEKCDIVINATALKDGLPVAAEVIEQAEFALDINYGSDTEFLKTARQSGVDNADGEEMLFAQSYFVDALVSGVRPEFAEFSKLYKELKQEK